MGINVVIIAAIALLVFIIIALIVSDRGKDFNEATQSCVTKGGRCAISAPDSSANWMRMPEGAPGEFGCGPQEYCWVYQYG